MIEVKIAALGIPVLGAVLLIFAAGFRIRAGRNSRQALPSLARSLGLNYRPSGLPGRSGEMNGIVEGHRVLIRPDKPALYVEYRFKLPGVLLSTGVERPEPGTRTVETVRLDTGNASIDGCFQTRLAPTGMRERLSDPRAAGKFHAALLDLSRMQRHRHHRVARITLQAGQLAVLLKTPRWLPLQACILPAEAQALLPAMLRVVRELEAALTGEGGE